MSENIGLEIIAKLNEAKSEKEINKSITKIKNNIKTLEIKLGKADMTVFKEMGKAVTDLSSKMKSFNNLMDKVKLQSSVVQTSFLKDGTKIKTEYNALNGEIAETIRGTKDYAVAQAEAGKQASASAKKVQSDYESLAKTVKSVSVEIDKVATKSVNGAKTQTTQTASNGNGVTVKTTDILGKDTIVEATEDYKKQAKVLEEINKLKSRGSLISTNLTDKYGTGSFDASKVAKINAEVNALSINTKEAKSETIRLAEAYNQVDKEAKQSYTNQKAQQQALNNATRLQNKYPTLAKNQDMSKIVEQIKSLDPAANNSKRKISELRVEMEKLHAATTSTARDSMTLGQQMQQAFGKFATWISATSAFYTALRGVKNVFSQILEINKQMTEISRVSDDQTDVQQVLANNVAIAKQLGNAITDVNEAAIEFARQGFKGADLTEITKVATLLSNISELDGQESSSILTASMKAFNVSAKETIHVVDALNEVDNNYAISTKQLAEGMQKSGAAAHTYGVTMENLLGYETAIGEISRESGSVLGNSLKTIFSRMTNNGNATAALKEAGVALYNTNGELRRVDEIMPDLADKWGKMSKAEQQYTAVNVAGMYQQSRFLNLMNNFGTAQEASAAATGSAGSAMKEQQTYMMSYEAKVNAMKNAWTEFALAFEKSIGGTLITGGTAALKGISEVLTSMTKTFGALPTTIGLATTALILFTKTGRDTASTMTGVMLSGLKKVDSGYKSVAASASSSSIADGITGLAKKNKSGTLSIDRNASKTGLKATGLGDLTKVTANVSKATVATGGLTKAFGTLGVVGAAVGGTLASAILPLAAITALSWGIQKLIGVYQKKKAAEEALEKQQKTLVSGYKTNAKSIDENIEKYERLSILEEKGAISAADQKELVSVQNQLNTAMPTLTNNIDSQGNAHLKTTEAIKEQIKYIKSLSIAQAATYNEEKAPKAIKKQADTLNALAKEAKNASEAIDKANAQKSYAGADPESNLVLDESFFKESSKDKFKSDLQEAVRRNKEQAAFNTLKEEEIAIGQHYLTMTESKVKLGKDEQNILNATLATSRESLKKDSSKKNVAQYQERTEEMTEQLAQLKKASGDSWENIKSPLTAAIEDGGEIDSAEKLVKAYNQIQKARRDMLDKDNNYDLDKNGDLTNKAQEKYENALQKTGMSATEAGRQTAIFAKEVKNLNDASKETAEDGLSTLSETQQDYLDKIKEGLAIDEVNAQKSVEDIMAGVSGDQVDTSLEMLSVYKSLSEQENLSVQQKELLAEATSYLSGTYGIANKDMAKSIPVIEQQISVSGTLQSAATALAEGQITDSQRTKLAILQNTSSIITAYEAQINAANAAKKAVDRAKEEQEERYGDGMTAENNLMKNSAKSMAEDDVLKEAKEGLAKAQKEQVAQAADLQSSLDTTSNALEGTASATDGATDATSDYTTELKSAKFVEDTYAKSLEKVNALISRNNALRGLMASYSKSYQKSLKSEIKLQESQLKLQEAQSKSLANQIKSGKIKEYGVIDTSTSSTVVGTGKSSGGTGTHSADSSGGINTTYTGSILNSVRDNWSEQVKKVAADMGVTLTKGSLDAVLGRITRESGGSETIVNNWDDNAKRGTPSKGLVQYIDPTFDTWKVKGHENILSGTDQLYAMFNNTNWLEDITSNSWWGPNGSKRTNGAVGNSASSSSSSTSTTIDNGTTDKANNQSSVSQANSDLTSLQTDIVNTKVKIQELKDELAQSQIDALANEVEKAQHKADLVLAQAEFNDPTSSKYRKKQDQAAKYYNEVISKKQKELSLIKQLQKSSGISESKKAELESEQRSLELDILSTQQDQQEVYLAKINSRIDEFQEAIDKTADTIARAASLEAQSPNSQAVKNKAIKDTLKAYKEQEKTIKKQLEYVKTEAKNSKLSAASKQELIEKQRELTTSINESKQAEIEYRRSIADDAITTMKDAIQQQSDAISAMYDKEVEDAQKANEKKQAKYDKDVTAYKKAVQEKLDALDDASSSRSFTKQMEKLQKEESTLRQQINSLALDDSAAAKAKRKELQEQLDENKDSQDDLKYDRDKELQSNALNDAADKYEETINNTKEVEQAALDAKVEALNKEKEDASYQFQEVLNNTSFWEKMADSITKGSTKEATKMMNDFSNSLKGITTQTAEDLGISSTSLTSAAKSLDDAAKNLAALSGNTYKNSGSTSQTNVSKTSAWGSYLSNTNELTSASGARKTELEAENKKLAKEYGFISGSYEELSYIDISKGNGTAKSKAKSKAFSEYVENARQMELESLSTATYNKLSSSNAALAKQYGFPTGKSYENLSKLKVYHTGGIVGQDANFVNGIAKDGLASNEQLAKLLKGEVVLSKSGIANVADSMRNLSAIAATVPTLSKTESSSNGNFSLNIESIVAKDDTHAKRYANTVATEFMNVMRGNGMKL